MKIRHAIALVLAFLLTALMIIAFSNHPFAKAGIVTQKQNSKSAMDLFQSIDASSFRGITLPKSPTIIRQRLVKTNANLITPTRGQALRLNLFDDAAFNVLIERIETQTRQGKPRSLNSGFVQFGRIQGLPTSEVYLVKRGGTVVGNVRLPDGKLYEIRSVGSGLQSVIEVNTAAFGPDHNPEAFKKVQQRSEQGRPRDLGVEKFIDGSAGLRVLVLYTAQARQAAGGTQDDMDALISLAESEANQGFRNSKIPATVRVTAVSEVNFPESSSSTSNINRLETVSDRIAPLRRRVGADAVSLWVSDMDACGIGNLNRSKFQFENTPFTVVQLSCATGYYSFAHELGHNLGATHDGRNSDPNEGLFPYSHGYQDPNGRFRTIMAYKDGCDGQCTRLNVWSSPDLVVKSSGLAAPLGTDGTADNARGLRQVL